MLSENTALEHKFVLLTFAYYYGLIDGLAIGVVVSSYVTQAVKRWCVRRKENL